VNRGSIFSFSDGKSLNAQQLGSGAIDVNAWITQESPLDTKQIPLKDEILEQYADWTPELQDILYASSGEIKCRSLYMLPVGFKWDHKPGVTIIGDAAHLITPFGGEGVNLAFQDALRLSNTIIDAETADIELSLDARVSAFEEDMFVRGQKAQSMTEGMMRAMLFTEGAPRSSIATWILKKVEYDLSPSISPVVYPLLAGATHSFFFLYKLFV
jgi:2-polyprenyl-6-methoxyphenol hydroxylase-like FAD-dependent oxidoreductase